MPSLVSILRLLLGLPLVIQSLTASAGDRVFESFQSEVEPILDSYCYDCHGFGTSKGASHWMNSLPKRSGTTSSGYVS